MDGVAELGLVGVGNIGSVFADAFLKAGHRVVGFSRPENDGFKERGGISANTARDIAQAVELVFCCLPDERAAEECYGGPDGVLAGLRPASIVVDLASYTLPFKSHLAEQVAQAGALMIDGEVSGTPDMLRSGGGSIYLAGDAAAVELCLPFCGLVTGEVFNLGSFGAATKMKLVNNLLSAVHTAAAAEAMALGVKVGFQPDLLAKVLASGSGSSKFLVSRAPVMASRQFDSSTGRLSVFSKYLEHIPDLADNAGCATPLFDAARRCFQAALDRGWGSRDIAVVYDVIQEMSRSDHTVPEQHEPT
ncbi:NAD(P)-dependent oxidoreductase [Roseomonas sp. KE2513]|uniref:NAD(P)-dependent oxidoreductase n=1 Tax=Roseomonas sp. KE2513 TaxID=2479202 RepID=UPI0018DF80A0|nr:NAD(P)-dependent oxidoreductase [Roseomonas sp. KE2513]